MVGTWLFEPTVTISASLSGRIISGRLGAEEEETGRTAAVAVLLATRLYMFSTPSAATTTPFTLKEKS